MIDALSVAAKQFISVAGVTREGNHQKLPLTLNTIVYNTNWLLVGNLSFMAIVRRGSCGNKFGCVNFLRTERRK